MLDKMGMTPASRAKLGLDLVKSATLAEATEPDEEKRMKMLRTSGSSKVRRLTMTTEETQPLGRAESNDDLCLVFVIWGVGC